MSHQDGRCAADAETIYVEQSAHCVAPSAGGAGTSSAPVCSLADAFGFLSSKRKVITVKGPSAVGGGALDSALGQVTVVGKAGAVLSGVGSAVLDVSGTLYIRNVKIGPSATVGLAARKGATLLGSKLVIDGNQGGGVLIDGASFNISNSTISNNGPGQTGTAVWGGVLVLSVSTSGGDGTLRLVSVIDNKQVGVTCGDGILADGLYASGNAGGVQVNPNCGLWKACTAPGPTCGAQ